MPAKSYDAVIVGAGPNGFAAAITLARAGLSTLLVERGETVGGGMRSGALTLPGFTHDICSAVHPLGIASPFFRSLDLPRDGLEWIDSPSPIAHVMDDGSATVLERSVEATAAQFDPADADRYRSLMLPFVEHFGQLLPMTLAPLRFPRHPILMARFGLVALRSMFGLARRFRGPRPAALLAGIAAHAMLPLESLATASFGLLLGLIGHVVGWPIAKGGSQSIANALAGRYQSLGGELLLGTTVTRLADLPRARAYLLDVSARDLVRIADAELSPLYKHRARRLRYGPGVFKVDWALSGPIPWLDPRCSRAVTVHLAGGIADVAAAERAVHEGVLSPRPFVLLGQPSIVDDTRAPNGQHTAWAYCHVPHGSTVNALEAIERQVERHAPGFRDTILARSMHNAQQMEAYDPNFVGGDINSGLSDLLQLFFRPMLKLDPYATSAPNVFLCSSSTPPGGGVHGMCGWWAARSALRKRFGIRDEKLSSDLRGASRLVGAAAAVSRA